MAPHPLAFEARRRGALEVHLVSVQSLCYSGPVSAQIRQGPPIAAHIRSNRFWSALRSKKPARHGRGFHCAGPEHGYHFTSFPYCMASCSNTYAADVPVLPGGMRVYEHGAVPGRSWARAAGIRRIARALCRDASGWPDPARFPHVTDTGWFCDLHVQRLLEVDTRTRRSNPCRGRVGHGHAPGTAHARGI